MIISIYSSSKINPGAVALADAAMTLGARVLISNFETDEDKRILFDSDIFIPRIAHKTLKMAQQRVAEYTSHNKQGLLAISKYCLEQSSNKYNSYKVLSAKGLSTPKTYMVSDLTDCSAQDLESKMPLVLKPVDDNRGVGVVLVRTAEALYYEASLLLKKYGRFIAQDFVDTASGCDIRAFVVGDKVVASMERRASEGEFVANLAQGGTARSIELSNEDKMLAVSATRALDAYFAGVDLLQGADGKIVLEVNPSPGFKVAAITGVDVPLLVIRELLKQKETI